MRRVTLMDKHMSQVIWHGGFPMCRGSVIKWLDEVARSTGEKNWLRICDAGLLGNYQYNEQHGYPPKGTEPISLANFKAMIGAEP